MSIRSLSSAVRKALSNADPAATMPHEFRGVASGIVKSVDSLREGLREGMAATVESHVIELKKELEEAIGGTIEIIMSLSLVLERMQKSIDEMNAKMDILSKTVDALKNAPITVEADSAFKKDLDAVVVLLEDLKNIPRPKL